MYRIIFRPRAQRDLRGLPGAVVERLMPKIAELSTEPRPHGAKKLSGARDTWRIRVGDYRVLYRIDDAIRIVEVRNAGHRRDIYL